MRALAKEPKDRYQSSAEMRGELEPLLRDPIANEQDFRFLGPSRESTQSARVIAAPPQIAPDAAAESSSLAPASPEASDDQPAPPSR